MRYTVVQEPDQTYTVVDNLEGTRVRYPVTHVARDTAHREAARLNRIWDQTPMAQRNIPHRQQPYHINERGVPANIYTGEELEL